MKLEGKMIVYRLRGNRFVSLYCSDVPERSIYPEYDYVSFSLDKNFNYTGGESCKTRVIVVKIKSVNIKGGRNLALVFLYVYRGKDE